MQNKNSAPDLGKATDWSFANQLLGGRDNVESDQKPCQLILCRFWKPTQEKEKRRKMGKEQGGGGERKREIERIQTSTGIIESKQNVFFGHGWVSMGLLFREIQWSLHEIWNFMPTVSWTATKTLTLNSFKTSKQTKIPTSPCPQKQYRSTRTM